MKTVKSVKAFEGTELSVLDRIIILKILPKEGDFTTLKILQQLKLSIGFSEAEHKQAGFQPQDGGMLTWKEFITIINIGEKATVIIKEQLRELDKAKKLDETMIPLYEKFCTE